MMQCQINAKCRFLLLVATTTRLVLVQCTVYVPADRLTTGAGVSLSRRQQLLQLLSSQVKTLLADADSGSRRQRSVLSRADSCSEIDSSSIFGWCKLAFYNYSIRPAHDQVATRTEVNKK